MPELRISNVVFLLLLALSCVDGYAQGATKTITATSCARDDVQAAINSANAGDTISVPAGTCAWTSGITFTKGIHLTGNALGRVTLVHNAGSDYLLQVSEDAAHVSEISQLRFVQGTANADAHLAVRRGGRPVLVHDNYFETNGGLLRAIRWGPNGGVIYRNEFYSNGVDDQAIVFVDDGNTESWATASSMGMDDINGESNTYVEDNVFRDLRLQALDPDGNSRVVIRHNQFETSGMASHGTGTGDHGTRHWEIYDNTFTFTDFGDCDGSQTPDLNWFFYARGGTGVITDNQLPDINSCAWGDKSEILMTVFNVRRNAGGYPCWTSYPVPRQIGQSHDGISPITEPVHIWGNTGGGTYGVGDFDPDQCGNGLSSSDFIQLGRDFILSPKPGYAKYTYPHPLRGAVSAIFFDGFEAPILR